ncbi:hypothetical protein [Psychrobacillus sp. OK032]|uniref:hypothetical protein n=1 Tax=Psychrobacillus sp. OK032 TaxID=1884358 RepID=UPI0008C22035|nr:hypothetical protein [Psychrobacillus sp. OK032]SES18966.1 hypothetical protein SAMN05518872_105218 [Psychrobacillus sp. OK032]
MLLILSILIVLGYTTFLIFKISFNTEKLAGMTAMIIVMSLGMMSSLVIGLISGIIYKNDLTSSTILAIVLSLFVGYFLGKGLGLVVIIEGMAASLMGSMMGAMLGEMLPSENFQIMLAFMDALYIIVVYLILLQIRDILRKSSDKAPTINHTYTSIFIMVILIAIVLFTTFYEVNHTEKQINDRPVENQLNEHNHH